MICYRDMTFCRAKECGKFSTCHRAVTDEVERASQDMGLPLCLWANPKKLECYQAPKPIQAHQPIQPTDGKDESI